MRRRFAFLLVSMLVAVSAVSVFTRFSSGSAEPVLDPASEQAALASPDGGPESVVTPGPEGDLDVDAAAEAGQDVDAGGLDPRLEEALDRARQAASADGIELPVSSGYRSPGEQARLLEAELADRGSWEEATRWVFPPDRSMHVRGLAIDIDSGPGADWLERNGAAFGFCKTLGWEWWHFEWRQRWEQDETCPAPAQTLDAAPEQ